MKIITIKVANQLHCLLKYKSKIKFFHEKPQKIFGKSRGKFVLFFNSR